MKTYIVYFTEPICINDELFSSYETHSLNFAKKIIKENINKYKGSAIYKFWNNGDFENLGEINLNGSNKTFVANTKQKKENY